MAADTAFHMIQGLETLHVRMARHVSNAERIAEFLNAAPEVSWVAYPGLDTHPDHALAGRLLPNGSGSIFSFGIQGGRAAGATFIESLELWSHLANVGDVRSLVVHPGSTTHQQMTSEQLAAAGIGEDLIRLSVGLEDPDDLIADLARALEISQRQASKSQ